VTDENRAEVVGQIINLNPELVYISAAANQTIQLVAALRAAGYKGSVLGTESLNSQSKISEAGALLVEGGNLYFTITNPPVSYYPNAAKFVQDFETQYRKAPSSFAARAYDATGICLKAIEEATRAKGGILPTRAEVAEAIRAQKDYEGITGTYNFNIKGDLSPAPYYVHQVVAIDPAGWNQNPIFGPYEVILPQP
jgi:ABC-type branched-subunit amino acid transport system substrate-binding protein